MNYLTDLTKTALTKEWDLILDEPAPDIFSWPLLNKDYCAEIIRRAESVGDWKSDRHAVYPTTDLLLEAFDFNEEYSSILTEYVYPAAIHKWKLEGKQWNNLSFESFIVKYTPNNQNHLSLHHDGSRITAILTLNDDFSGGGTYFDKQDFLLKRGVGSVSIHPGTITHRHGARPIEAGVRYTIVTFSNFK